MLGVITAGYLPPSPRDLVSKDTSEEWPNNTRAAVGSPQYPSESGPLLWRSRKSNDCVCTAANTSTTHASNRSTNDEGGAIRSNSTNQGANFKDKDGDQKGALQRKILISFPPCRLERGER